MLLRPAGKARRGVSLLEAILATSLLLIVVGLLQQMLSGSTRQARDVRDNGFAVQLAQSKIQEVASGVTQPGSGGSYTDFTPIAGSSSTSNSDVRDSSSDYEWAMDVVKDQVQSGGGTAGGASGGTNLTGIWQVEVRVRRKGAGDDEGDIVVIRQLIIDPSRRGSTFDTASIAGSSTEPATNDSSTTPSTGGTTSGGGATTGGATTTGGGTKKP